MNIEERLELLETRNALLDLISGYAQGFDNHDTDLLRNVFHENAVLDLDVFGTFEGIDGIVGAANMFWDAAPHMHHWMANPLIEIDLDAGKASASTSLDCLCTYVESGTSHIGGRYRDNFTRIDGRWWIAERIFDLQFMTPMPEWKPTQGSEADLAGAGA
jgi:hypothetical protein